MPRDTALYLRDIGIAASLIQDFVAGKSLEDYLGDSLLRSAVERQFAILGEAVAQLRNQAPEIAARISDARDIIGFRNQLVHSYSTIADETVWSFIHSYLPVLAEQAASLLQGLAHKPNT